MAGLDEYRFRRLATYSHLTSPRRVMCRRRVMYLRRVTCLRRAWFRCRLS